MTASGSGPREEGKSFTVALGTGPESPLPSAAAQNGTPNILNTTRVPSTFHVLKMTLCVAAVSRARVPRARSSASMTLPPISTRSRRPSGEIRGFGY